MSTFCRRAVLSSAVLIASIVPTTIAFHTTGPAFLPHPLSTATSRNNNGNSLTSLAAIIATTDDSATRSTCCRNNKASKSSQQNTKTARITDYTTNNDVSRRRRVVKTVSSLLAMTFFSTLLTSSQLSFPAFADEYGRETEAPTLGTGESVMICTKRGPLGACLATERRTEANENDKSEKYFRQPTELVKRKDDEARKAETENGGEGNALIERLKKQSEENSEKNTLLVRQRTLMNDSSASFGPFDSQVLILNEDGNGFTLLANPQAMRLKKQGLIENKKFTRQPTQEELDAALRPPDSSAGSNILDRILGSSS